jgi:hypothetical protein
MQVMWVFSVVAQEQFPIDLFAFKGAMIISTVFI